MYQSNTLFIVLSSTMTCAFLVKLSVCIHDIMQTHTRKIEDTIELVKQNLV